MKYDQESGKKKSTVDDCFFFTRLRQSRTFHRFICSFFLERFLTVFFWVNVSNSFFFLAFFVETN